MTGDSNIDIGNTGVADESDTIRIGSEGTQTRTFIAGIREQQVGNDAVTVIIDSFGKLGTTVSSRRFKKEIKPMDKASEAILLLVVCCLIFLLSLSTPSDSCLNFCI